MRSILLAILLVLPAAGQGVYTYHLRGEVRLLLLWLGKDDVGGGRVTVARGARSTNQWREEIEVLFGSDSERIPGKINHWGYAREISEWVEQAGSTAPHLAATEFQGIMRHSTESSIDEAVAATKKSAASGLYLYDASLSKVLPESAWHEIRLLSEPEDFDYRRPERLLGSFQKALAEMPPASRSQLAYRPGLYGAPYGFLTGLDELIRRLGQTGKRDSLTFVYNSKPYTLEVLGVRRVPESQVQAAWRAMGARELSQVRFRSFNTVKRTRTDFELWIPMAGEHKGIPVRILLQPRWWLRLRMDLTSAAHSRAAGTQ